ncbi:hypothetical protein JCM3774_004932 [Rhodotorula dairenensis]
MVIPRCKATLAAVFLAVCGGRSLFAFAAAAPHHIRTNGLDVAAVDRELQLYFSEAGHNAGNPVDGSDAALKCTQQVHVAGSHPPFHLSSVAVVPDHDLSDPQTHSVLSHIGRWTTAPGTIAWNVDLPANTPFVLRLTDGKGDVRLTKPSIAAACSERMAPSK